MGIIWNKGATLMAKLYPWPRTKNPLICTFQGGQN